jgi:glycosyltransferase involved in cell wall biosynthesis
MTDNQGSRQKFRLTNPGGHILMLSYFFPPSGAGGVQRSLKMAKYLSLLGTRVTVVTPKPISYLAYDEALLSELPKQVKVVRTSSADPARLLKIISDVMKRGASSPGKNVKKARGVTGARLFQHLKWWFAIPDAEVLWLPFAFPAAGRLISSSAVDVIYSTSPPASSHLLAMQLKARYHIPWIADFRDLWADHYDFKNRPLINRTIIQDMEKAVFTYADRIICNTRGMYELYEHKHTYAKNRLVYIPNGYDENDFMDLNATKNDDGKLHLVHMGTLRGRRSLTTVFAALKTAMEYSGIGSSWVFDQVGSYHEFLVQGSNELGISDQVCMHGNLSHTEAIKMAAGADALLLLVSSDEGSLLVPAKLYEYLRLGKPIVVLAPPGEAEKIAREYGQARVFAPDDAQGLAEWLMQGKPVEKTVNSDEIEFFKRVNLARLLQDLVKVVISAE